MKPAPRLAELLTDARKKYNLTQLELARRSGLNNKRISGFERQRHVPGPQEIEALARHLRIPKATLRLAITESKPGCPRLKQKFRQHSRWVEVRKDRPSEKRYWKARKAWPGLVERLERKLMARADSDALRVYLRDACFGSKLEYVAHLLILEAGATTDRFSPQLSGFGELPVIDPLTRVTTGHQKYPAMGFRGMLLIPQVTLLTPTEGPLTVDLLWGIKPNLWKIIEFDGTGHDWERDDHRDRALQLPVFHFSTSEVISESFLDRIHPA